MVIIENTKFIHSYQKWKNSGTQFKQNSFNVKTVHVMCEFAADWSAKIAKNVHDIDFNWLYAHNPTIYLPEVA